MPAGWYVQSIRLPWVSARPSAEGLQEKPCSQALGSNAASTWVPLSAVTPLAVSHKCFLQHTALPLTGHLSLLTGPEPSLRIPLRLPRGPVPHPGRPTAAHGHLGALPPALARHLLQRGPPHCGTVLRATSHVQGTTCAAVGPAWSLPPAPLRLPGG